MRDLPPLLRDILSPVADVRECYTPHGKLSLIFSSYTRHSINWRLLLYKDDAVAYKKYQRTELLSPFSLLRFADQVDVVWDMTVWAWLFRILLLSRSTTYRVCVMLGDLTQNEVHRLAVSKSEFLDVIK